MTEKPSYEELELKVKRIEKEEEKFEFLAKVAFEAIVLSKSGICIDANEAALKMFGYTRDEFVGSHALEFIAPESKEQVKYRLEQKEPEPREMFGLRKDGTRFLMKVKAKTLPYKGDTVRVTAIQDITERMEAEVALKVSEAKSNTILESAQDGIVLSDFDTTERQYVNQALADMLGYTKEKLLTIMFRDTVDLETVEMFKDIGRKMIRTQKAVRGIEYEMIKKDGSRITVSSTSAPLTNAEGRITGVVGIMRDITKHKQAEKEIKKARDDYHTITTLIADIIVQVDAEGCFTFLNDHACTFWGHPREAIIGTSFYDYMHPDDKERSSDVIQKAIMENREERGLINRQKTKEGYKTIEWNGIPFFNRKEQYIGFQASGRDITDRINAEENLKEMNTALKILLKQRDRDKTEIEEKVLTNVKELISPYLEKLHKSPLNDRQSNLLTIIESNIDEIVSPFLHRLSSEYSSLTPREIQVAGLVKDGKTTKEIAELLSAGIDAINFHRSNLRLKLGLTNKKANLRSYLLSHMY